MARRKHLPLEKAGERWNGWMPFVNDEPLFVGDPLATEPRAEVYATRKDARTVAEDVRFVIITVRKVTR